MTEYVHRDGKRCYFAEGEWRTRWAGDNLAFPEVWTDEGEEVPDFLPCAREHPDV
jgi:hypothetical protein